MHCREFESRLNDILDDRGQPRADAQLAAHAEACDGCREMLDGYQALFAGLTRRAFPSPSAEFSQRVVEEVVPAVVVSHGASARRIGWAVATVFTTAAAVLLVVSLVWQARRGGPAPQSDHKLVGAPNTPQQPHRGAAPGGLAVAHGDWLIEAPRLPSRIRGSYRGTIDNLAVTLPETVERLDEVEHFAPGIRPIRISLGVLLDALWRTIPGSHEGNQPSTRTSYHRADLRHLA